MKLVKPSFKIESSIDIKLLRRLEEYGRTCYKSENNITSDSAKKFVKMLINSGHESVLEHAIITVRFICDRGVSHELVRHRIASFSQESTRYCNYKGGVTFIIPSWLCVPEGNYKIDWEGLFGKCNTEPVMLSDELGSLNWFWNCAISERDYLKLISKGWAPQEARTVLTNSLKTEIVVTANLREWRTILKLRTSKNAHPQMRELMRPLLDTLKELIPVIFDDITYE
jgi:thymidylate synthase (FAD)